MGLTRKSGTERITATVDKDFSGSNNWAAVGTATHNVTSGYLLMTNDSNEDVNGTKLQASRFTGLRQSTYYIVSARLRSVSVGNQGNIYAGFGDTIPGFNTEYANTFGTLDNSFTTYTTIVKTPDDFDKVNDFLYIWHLVPDSVGWFVDDVSVQEATTYTNVFYDVVLDGIRDLLITEYNGTDVYISPKKLYDKPFQIQLWGESASSDIHTAQSWQRTYQTTIKLHFAESSPGEFFYEQIYADVERVAQVLFNNTNKTITVEGDKITWVEGLIANIEIGENEEQEGVYTATIEFNCKVNR